MGESKELYLLYGQTIDFCDDHARMYNLAGRVLTFSPGRRSRSNGYMKRDVHNRDNELSNYLFECFGSALALQRPMKSAVCVIRIVAFDRDHIAVS
jgi:hypothetical protein